MHIIILDCMYIFYYIMNFLFLIAVMFIKEVERSTVRQKHSSGFFL